MSLQDVNINLVAAKGKSKVMFFCNLCKIIVFCILMIAGAKLGGIYGLLISMIVYALVAYLVFAVLSSHYLNNSIWGQLWGIVQCLLLALVPLVATYFVSQTFLLGLPNIVQVIIEATIFAIVYLSIAYLTKNNALRYLLGMIQRNKNG